MGLSKLAQAMANDGALSPTARNPNAPHILSATPASGGNEGDLPDWADALLIMNGCSAKYVINYWRVENKWGAVAHVSRFNNYDEWATSIKHLVEKKT